MGKHDTSTNGRRLRSAAAMLILMLLSACVVSAGDLMPSVTPANPAFVSYADNPEPGLGLVPLPVDIPDLKPKPEPRILDMTTIPSTYDLRTQNKLTGVRNQGSCGACWAFATYGSLESSLMPYETWDFAENHMKNTSGFDLTCCYGGNHLMSTAYLTRWSGPAAELDDPFNQGNCTSPPGLAVHKHIQDVIFLPDRSGPLDNDGIKTAVMTHGAVYTCFYWNASYYNSSTRAYHYTGSSTVNHAVCIVGWDDDFDRGNFLTTPPGDGAFLIKNSWGTGWGDVGYFWISYYDSKVGTENAQFHAAEPTINYDHAYQYDPLGWTQSLGYGSNTAWCANVFTANALEELKAVSFYTPAPNSGYEVRIYLDPAAGPIGQTGAAVSETGDFTFAGYHTVQLGSSVTLDAGQRFSVVVKLSTPSYNYPISMESAVSGYSSNGVTASPGQSYISSNGTSWTDLTSTYSQANVCIKAFTTDALGLQVSPSTGFSAVGPSGGPFSPTGQVYTLTNSSAEEIGWSAVKNQSWVGLSSTGGTLAPGASCDVTVSLAPEAYNLGNGSYSDVVQFINETGGTGSTSRSIHLLVSSGSLSVTPATGLSSAGAVGGPFEPSSAVYTLTNPGGTPISWATQSTQSWVTVSPDQGSLEPSESVQVTVSTNAIASTLPAGSYSDTVSFANLTNGVGNTTRSVSLSVIPSYEMLPAAFEWIEPDGQSFSLGDDGVSPAQSIPFPFTFYGVPYSQFYIGANGLLGFASGGMNEYRNADMPNSSLPNAIICPYWDDLDTGTVGRVYVDVIGAAPRRRLVVTWYDVTRYLSSSYLRFQVLLCETTNDIVLNYLEVNPGDAIAGAGRSATVGIENASGTSARKYSFNGSTLLQNGQTILFTTNRPVGIPEAKRQADGISCGISDALVSAATDPDRFYVQTDDGTCGLAVLKESHELSPGWRVVLVGHTATDDSGEKCIIASAAAPTGQVDDPKSLAMTNRFVGGEDWFYDPDTKAGQKGVHDAHGLNNIGALVTTFGRITYADATCLYVDDGSGIMDDSGHSGIKVLTATGEGQGLVGEFVVVMGISSCFTGTPPDTCLYRLIRATDVQLF